ncbi:MAG TPA: hypothetical protein VFI90_10680 [Rubrobacter sp.]|nr:hypothetical protein [Rubrobacter sp.]
MIRNAAGKIMWVGRATVFIVGLAVILALVVGIASAALAGTGVGDTFNLGRLNTVNRVSQLVGSTDNAMLRVDNNNAGTNATALDLQVEPGLTPMKVSSSTQVSNLNADLVDGRSASSFVANGTYRLGQGQERAGTPLGDNSKVLSQACLAGDRLLSGGPASVNVNSDVLDSFATDTNKWQARINDSAVSGGDDFTVVVLCADQ